MTYETDNPGSERERREERVIALLLGELSPEDASEVQQWIQDDRQLLSFYNRMKSVIGLVELAANGEAARQKSEQEPAEPVLSDDRREALLEKLREPRGDDDVSVAGSEGDGGNGGRKKRRPRWMPLAIAAGLVGIIGVGVTFFQPLAKRSTVGRTMEPAAGEEYSMFLADEVESSDEVVELMVSERSEIAPPSSMPPSSHSDAYAPRAPSDGEAENKEVAKVEIFLPGQQQAAGEPTVEDFAAFDSEGQSKYFRWGTKTADAPSPSAAPIQFPGVAMQAAEVPPAAPPQSAGQGGQGGGGGFGEKVSGNSGRQGLDGALAFTQPEVKSQSSSEFLVVSPLAKSTPPPPPAEPSSPVMAGRQLAPNEQAMPERKRNVTAGDEVRELERLRRSEPMAERSLGLKRAQTKTEKQVADLQAEMAENEVRSRSRTVDELAGVEAGAEFRMKAKGAAAAESNRGRGEGLQQMAEALPEPQAPRKPASPSPRPTSPEPAGAAPYSGLADRRQAGQAGGRAQAADDRKSDLAAARVERELDERDATGTRSRLGRMVESKPAPSSDPTPMDAFGMALDSPAEAAGKAVGRDKAESSSEEVQGSQVKNQGGAGEEVMFVPESLTKLPEKKVAPARSMNRPGLANGRELAQREQSAERLEEKRIERAKARFSDRDFEGAQAEMDQLLREVPDSAKAREFKAYVSATAANQVGSVPQGAVEKAVENQMAAQESRRQVELVTEAEPTVGFAMTDLVAVEPLAEQPASDTSHLVQDGKLLYKMQLVDEAKDKLKEAIAKNPDDKDAYFYLSQIQEAEDGDDARKQDAMEREGTRGPNPWFRTNTTAESSISMIPEEGGLKPASEGSGQEDGNMLLDAFGQPFEPSSHQTDESPALPLLDAFGEPLGTVESGTSEEWVDLENVLIKIDPPLKDLTAAQALDAIAQGGDVPVNVAIHDYAVVIHPAGEGRDYSRFVVRTDSVSGRKLVDKLNKIKIDELQLDQLPLIEVVRNLNDELKRLDTEGKGVNFILNPFARSVPKTSRGRVLNVRVAEDPSLNAELEVDERGIVQLPGVGRIDLNGLSLSQASETIEKALESSVLRKATVTLGTRVQEADEAAVQAKAPAIAKAVPSEEKKQPAKPQPPKPPEPENLEEPQVEEDRATPVPAAVLEPKPEIETAGNAFSTFSLNVSDVSFKLAAAALEQGKLPEAGRIRSEEFINALDYHDPAPVGEDRIAFAWDHARHPFAHNRDLIRFSIQTAAAGRERGTPLNLVLLLDSSGSMERADRVTIVREAMRVLAGQLKPQDRISVIGFARTPRLWVDGMQGGNSEPLLQQALNLNPEGGTNLEAAMDLAYEVAERHFLPDGNNRVILMTDGAANLGNVQPEALKAKVEEQRRKRIALDCFGVGWEGYNDDLLEVLSRNGDGRYGFINSPREAATEFADQLAGALQVAAMNVKAQVEFNPRRVKLWRQVGYDLHQLTKEQFRDNTVDAAEIGAAESGTALYAMQVDPNGSGPLGTVRVRYLVPETGEYEEREWLLPHTAPVPAMNEAPSALRLAAAAASFAEWLARNPYAGAVTPRDLQSLMQGLSAEFPNDQRVRMLQEMIANARRIGR